MSKFKISNVALSENQNENQSVCWSIIKVDSFLFLPSNINKSNSYDSRQKVYKCLNDRGFFTSKDIKEHQIVFLFDIYGNLNKIVIFSVPGKLLFTLIKV